MASYGSSLTRSRQSRANSANRADSANPADLPPRLPPLQIISRILLT
jgi:hypothetical protein